MRVGWIAYNGKFFPAEHTEHVKVAGTMPPGSFPAIKLCQNGYAFWEGYPEDRMSQAQLDTLWDWCQEEGSESWEVIADFLDINRLMPDKF